MNDSQLLAFFCPLCCASHFGSHWMSEYKREWNKCTSCGYMELQQTTKSRITSLVDPNGLTEPFVDPITTEMRNKVNSVKVDSNNVNCHNNSGQNCDCSCAD